MSGIEELLGCISALVSADGAIIDFASGALSYESGCRFCADCGYGKCDERATRLYGGREAYRWNGQYVYYCPLGLVFVAASLTGADGKPFAALIVGPLLMGDREEALFELPEPRLADRAAALSALDTEKVRHLARTLAAAAHLATGMRGGRADGIAYAQDKLLSAIYRAMPSDSTAAYPIEYEKRLMRLIALGDKSGAQELLNELLGHIYFASDFDLETIKARIVELTVVLSRATIDAGADVREVFQSNTGYIREIERFDSIEELSVWLTGIMHRFISSSFDFAQVKHSDVVFKAIEYVKANISGKIALDDVARHVFLSRSYLSSLFKAETGMSLFSYINRLRVEKSKLLLAENTVPLVDVAALCGFEDQSYFTRVFKRETGMAPKKYRDSRGGA